jgi:hypothetical protein
LHAISTCTSTGSPPAAASISGATMRLTRQLELSPCSGTPSRHSVASLPLSQSQSTRRPAHAFGAVARARNQYVDHCGPKVSPSLAGR